jgi:hypothetical protein
MNIMVLKEGQRGRDVDVDGLKSAGKQLWGEKGERRAYFIL